MSKTLIVGDVHLGKNNNLGKSSLESNSRVDDQFRLLDWTLEQAELNNAEHMVFTGDVFEDPSPEVFILKRFAAWLKKATDKDINLYFIEGNHDFIRINEAYLSSLDIFNELKLNKIHFFRDFSSIQIDKYNYVFAPFRDRKSLFCSSQEEALDKVQKLMLDHKKDNSILIGHLAIKDSIPIGDEIDDLTNEIFIPYKFFKNFDFTWLGHIHKFQIFNKSPHIAHIGSLDISNFGEVDQSKFLVLFDNNNGEFDYIRVPVREYQIIEISVPEDIINTTEYILDHIKSIEVKDQVIKLEIKHLGTSNSTSNKKEIESLLKANNAFHVNAIIESKKIDMIKKRADILITDKNNVSASIDAYASKSELVPEDIKEKFLSLAKKIAKGEI